MANQTPSKSNKRTADDLVTPKTSKKAKPGIYEYSAKAPNTLDGGVSTGAVMAKYSEINNYNGLLRDLATDPPQLAEWVAVALAWTRAKGALECEEVDKHLSPWWNATKKERRKALSIHFS